MFEQYTPAEEYDAACEVLAMVIPDRIPDRAWGDLLAQAALDMIGRAMAAAEALPQ